MSGKVRPRGPGPQRPSLLVGLLVAAVTVAFATAAIYPLQVVASPVSLSVVYLPAVLLVSAYWGLGLGLVTSFASAAAFNWFHIPPVGRFTIADPRNWVALAAFTTVAVVVSAMAGLARRRALEAERRRGEADLAAGLARELLAGGDTPAALHATAAKVAETLMLPWARIGLGQLEATDKSSLALALRDTAGEQVATLMVPAELPADMLEQLGGHMASSLGALVAIGLHRDAVQAEVVRTAALRRSDELKTALLRAVSHDLRTPLTAIVAAGHALGTGSLTVDERLELSAAVVEEGERLSALIDKLLDLSRLQAGRAQPQLEWASIEEVLLSAREALAEGRRVRLSVDGDVPAVRVDAAQLERAFANLMENALRHSDRLPVSVHVRCAGQRLFVRVVDQGPGIDSAEQERIFEPFYRGPGNGRQPWSGAGLGLAIAKGFLEANGGSISVESLPGQGTSFVVVLPVTDGDQAGGDAVASGGQVAA